jgi:hypothetical protein
MQKSQDTIVVRIGVFSGLPNPEMELTGDSASRFADLIKSTIGRERIHAPPAPRLGEFYGFLVLIPDQRARAMGLPAQLSIVTGVVTEVREKTPAHWRDVSGVQLFLVRQAQERGFGDVLRKAGVTEQ